MAATVSMLWLFGPILVTGNGSPPLDGGLGSGRGVERVRGALVTRLRQGLPRRLTPALPRHWTGSRVTGKNTDVIGLKADAMTRLALQDVPLVNVETDKVFATAAYHAKTPLPGSHGGCSSHSGSDCRRHDRSMDHDPQGNHISLTEHLEEIGVVQPTISCLVWMSALEERSWRRLRPTCRTTARFSVACPCRTRLSSTRKPSSSTRCSRFWIA